HLEQVLGGCRQRQGSPRAFWPNWNIGPERDQELCRSGCGPQARGQEDRGEAEQRLCRGRRAARGLTSAGPRNRSRGGNMGARQKLNGAVLNGCALVAGALGVLSGS